MEKPVPVLDENKIHALALHNASQFLSLKNRRILEHAQNFTHFAEIVLGAQYKKFYREAELFLKESDLQLLLSFEDEDYPPLLKESDYAPFFLYLKGERALIKNSKISIVGSRGPSPMGRKAAASVARYFVAKGCTVVSGIARGVDSIAHHTALDAHGQTIAILPNGFNHLYPLENRDLYLRAAEDKNLLFISEYAPTQKAAKHHFVRRNRIIAALSMLTVFVEGGIKSGGLITVRHALAEGREVAALTHPLLLNNAGGEKLIADGALDLSALIVESNAQTY
ncbi:MAG TPA: DNA-processing protein DprA [Turneriella sp.]|nr:DNA-processing protein DprA [Turneriella sp.]